MLTRARQLLELIRFSHTVFALPFALLAGLMAWWRGAHEPPLVPFRLADLVGILLCMVAARSAAMAFNRIADRKLDAANPRTANRQLPTGQLTVAGVAVFAALAAALFVASTTLFLPANNLPLLLAGPLLLFLLGYSFTKRFTVLSHFWLGAALMLAPVSTWIALRGQLLWHSPADILPAVVLGAGVMFWVAGFDIIYACQDATFDQDAGLKSIPAAIGVPAALRIAAACHAATILLLSALPWMFPALGWIYGLGVGLIAGLLIFEHLLVRPEDLTRVNVAFFHVNAVISLGLMLVVAIDLWWPTAG
ncbi:MAG: 4-hydroxybenzoate octaprenyltransferase [Planctomycetales bacterium]|nr:4-hydroxybenzoate octaprenyltransferase [Planctomycetales bacterium]NIP86983.1 4-hydroxybenzoate octaprenyltransferase [Planctomycetales bacterium]